jgi:hypothetical protein
MGIRHAEPAAATAALRVLLSPRAAPVLACSRAFASRHSLPRFPRIPGEHSTVAEEAHRASKQVPCDRSLRLQRRRQGAAVSRLPRARTRHGCSAATGSTPIPSLAAYCRHACLCRVNKHGCLELHPARWRVRLRLSTTTLRSG